MPRIAPRNKAGTKRERMGVDTSFFSMVATPIKPSKIEKIPAAKAAVQAEWDKLKRLGCWDEGSVQELSAVKSKAVAIGKKIHVGRIFELCVEKHSELPPEQKI